MVTSHIANGPVVRVERNRDNDRVVVAGALDETCMPALLALPPTLSRNVRLDLSQVIAVSSRETIFPTIRIPEVEGYETVLQLLAGWNILVHVGVALGINLDKADRARKIGNEFVATP